MVLQIHGWETSWASLTFLSIGFYDLLRKADGLNPPKWYSHSLIIVPHLLLKLDGYAHISIDWLSMNIFCPHLTACGILVPQPRMEPVCCLLWKHGFWTTGPPRKSSMNLWYSGFEIPNTVSPLVWIDFLSDTRDLCLLPVTLETVGKKADSRAFFSPCIECGLLHLNSN